MTKQTDGWEERFKKEFKYSELWDSEWIKKPVMKFIESELTTQRQQTIEECIKAIKEVENFREYSPRTDTFGDGWNEHKAQSTEALLKLKESK
jgi:hypothetical protein